MSDLVVFLERHDELFVELLFDVRLFSAEADQRSLSRKRKGKNADKPVAVVKPKELIT